MDIKTRILAAACALLLCACASTGTSTGVRVGASYGAGDYYAGSRRERVDDWPWSFHVGMASWGGYCSARYRYCVDPFFYSMAWYGGWYSPFYYDPFWSQHWLYFHRQPYPRYDGVPDMPVAGSRAGRAPLRDAGERPRPRAWEERPAPRTRSAGSRPRPRPAWPTDG